MKHMAISAVTTLIAPTTAALHSNAARPTDGVPQRYMPSPSRRRSRILSESLTLLMITFCEYNPGWLVDSYRHLTSSIVIQRSPFLAEYISRSTQLKFIHGISFAGMAMAPLHEGAQKSSARDNQYLIPCPKFLDDHGGLP